MDAWDHFAYLPTFAGTVGCVRQCNWVRWLVITHDRAKSNLIILSRNKPTTFQTTQAVREREPLCLFLDAKKESMLKPTVQPGSLSFSVEAILQHIPPPLYTTQMSYLHHKQSSTKSDISKQVTPPPYTNSIGTSTITIKSKKYLACRFCSKKFDRPSLLTRHERIHTGEKPFKCDTADCKKSFSTSSSLNTHRRTHTGEKPHECKECGKRFAASSNLYYHRMTHTSKRPHKCDFCLKGFATPGDLRNHMHTHNNSWPYKCDGCVRGFAKATQLRAHQSQHDH